GFRSSFLLTFKNQSKMNRLFVMSTVLILAFAANLTGQNRSSRSSHIQSQKVAFLTKKMDLSVEEAEKFWPLYNEYSEQKDQLERTGRTKTSELTDDQAKEILEKQLANGKKEIAIKRDFLDKA